MPKQKVQVSLEPHLVKRARELRLNISGFINAHLDYKLKQSCERYQTCLRKSKENTECSNCGVKGLDAEYFIICMDKEGCTFQCIECANKPNKELKRHKRMVEYLIKQGCDKEIIEEISNRSFYSVAKQVEKEKLYPPEIGWFKVMSLKKWFDELFVVDIMHND